ncbi:MAG: hypothetical protein Kow0031_35590 [Anaerolineae bacterium]
MNIAILGTGNIGGTLGKKWATAGHAITYGVRNPTDSKYQAVVAKTGGQATLATLAQAAAAAEVVLLAIPGGAVDEFTAAHGDTLTGKIILDAANRVGQAELNNFAAISAAAPDAKLFRAFSTLGWENFETPELGGQPVDLFYCGDDGDARAVVEGLIGGIGLRPVYVGGRDQVGVIDGLTRLWFALAFGQGHGRRLALKMVSG